MNKIKIGDKLEIHCYKHNGKIHRTWDEAVVLDITEDYLVCGNNQTKVTENDGRTHRTKEPAIIFFYKNSWFNIIAQFKEFGLFYYCNIASPFVIEGLTIKYIDYDLDLRVFPDGSFKILDRGEYNYHKNKMKYSADIDYVLKKELSRLIDMAREKTGPFQKELIERYHKQYDEIKAKNQ